MIFISVFVGEVCNLFLYCGVIFPHLGKPVLQDRAADANLRAVGSVENAESRERGRLHKSYLLAELKETNSGGF